MPNMRTIFNSMVDYRPASTTASIIMAPTTASGVAALISSLNVSTAAATTTAAALACRDVCLPILKAGSWALVTTLPSFLKLDSGSPAKYYCFSDLDYCPPAQSKMTTRNTASAITIAAATATDADAQLLSFGLTNSPDGRQHPCHTDESQYHHYHQRQQEQQHTDQQAWSFTKQSEPMSLRHRLYQGQMKRPHLFLSLENYPNDGRIGPHIIAANFQAFLVVDLVLGLIHYRKYLEPFSTVVHHLFYFYMVKHMRAGDMLSLFCVCGAPVEASSIFLAYRRIYPHRRTPTVEWLYLFCFVSSRLIYVTFLWHELYFNYPDKSVAVLCTITLALHVYWFAIYIHAQRKFKSKQKRLAREAAVAAKRKDHVQNVAITNGLSPALAAVAIGGEEEEEDTRQRVSK
ncbi:hypothetical protein BGZ98_009421 [Dissophora globulifera]|nr:hypothetical protein BGZ98_009421 [Dissophora globulifera]